MGRWLGVAVWCAVLVAPASAAATHSGDVDCSSFSSQAAAQGHLDAHPGDPDGLDGDQDRKACETLPCPCVSPASAAPPPPAPLPPPAPPPLPPPAPPPPASPPPSTPPATLAATGRTITGATIVSVVDGDTLRVRLPSGARQTVRLVGIDAPETVKRGIALECGGRSATKYVTKLVMRRRGRRSVGQPVTLTTDPTQDQRDRYGRLLAYANVAGVDVGRRLVAAGWAAPYVYRGVPFNRAAAYFAAAQSAKDRSAGVWGGCGGDFHSED